MIQCRRSECYRVLASSVRPKERLAVSEWADRHRMLSSKQSGMPGRWSTDVNPILREIMDCLGDRSPVLEIVIMKSNQVGVTEAMVNGIGYFMHHAPGPAMVLMPTLADRDTWKTQKLNPLLQETPAIKELLGGLRSRDAANRSDVIDFPAGILFLSGGNSPNSYAQKTVRRIMLDDIDRFPAEIGKEGDVVALARGRVKSFPRRHKLMLVSTPTIKGASIIEREYLDSDQRKYHVPCPHCGEYQPLKWENVKYDRLTVPPQRAWYECDHCGEEIQESHKPRMLLAGRWIAAHPEVKRRGYHINALYAPIGLGPSWHDLAVEWVGIHRDKDGKSKPIDQAKLQTFLNLHLGITWEDRTAAVKPHDLARRADEVEQGIIPPGVLALTVGIDTQDTWLDVTLLGWRLWTDDGAPGWRVIEWTQFHGDTSRPGPWDELERWLNTERRNAFDQKNNIRAAAIDNRGHRGQEVRAFCQRQSIKVPIYRVQGSTSRQTAVIASTAREPERDGRGRVRRGAYGAWNVGTETTKDMIYGALKSDADHPPESRRIRFASGLPNDYYSGLMSEVRNPETGRYEQRKGAEYRRNEPLDGLVYAVAIGYHREVLIGMRRARIFREGAPSQIMTVFDLSWWSSAARALEPAGENHKQKEQDTKGAQEKQQTEENKPQSAIAMRHTRQPRRKNFVTEWRK